MSETKISSIKVILYNGTQKDYLIWSTKFQAKCLQSRRLGLLKGTVPLPTKAAYDAACLIAEATRDAAQKKTVVDYEKAMDVYTDLILSMDTMTEAGRVAFEEVGNAKTTDNPDGDPKLAFDTLTEKYEAKTAPNYLELNSEFTNSKLEDDEKDPGTDANEESNDADEELAP